MSTVVAVNRSTFSVCATAAPEAAMTPVTTIAIAKPHRIDLFELITHLHETG